MTPPRGGGQPSPRGGGKGKPSRGGKPAARAAKAGGRGGKGKPARAASVAPRRTADGGAVLTRSTGPKRGLGGEQVEGRQAVRELLMAGRRRVREVWVLAEQDPSPIIDDIVALAEAERVTVRDVGRSKFFAQARCESPQGVLAMAAPLPEAELDELAKARSGVLPFLVAVDGVTDPGNLGALLRSAECAGATGIVLPRHRAVHITPTVTKSAAGAVEHLPCAVVGGLPAAIQLLQRLGVWVVGLDGEGEVDLWQMPATDGPIALVLGAEGSGMSRLVKERCDAVVRIPLGGSLGSLNVAAAGALACFEVARARA